ncbi:MAG: hypothetical protein PUK72_05045 [Oscillospiraceae bacterium]|mgnify:FL=1|nr:hypothetical protein [Oscillospiraceae bacterium]MDD7470445.1 hypothetical protein [Oscillospiraceae bacterium]MDY2678829.1 hypothetical protein [Oscillospiraceae bacterium]
METDTVKLLRECDAGVEMGVSSISDVLERVENPKMKEMLSSCKLSHEKLGLEISKSLSAYGDGGKSPNPIAKSMSWMKTNAELSFRPSDKTVASLMTDGCNMGIKSLNRYLNQYKAADEKSKQTAKKLVSLEEGLVNDLREFL